MSCMAAPNKEKVTLLLTRAQVLLTHVIVPYADKFEHVTTVSPYGQQLLHARIEVVIGKIKQWTMKTWKKRKKMMKKYHQQKLAEHEADDVFRQHPC